MKPKVVPSSVVQKASSEAIKLFPEIKNGVSGEDIRYKVVTHPLSDWRDRSSCKGIDLYKLAEEEVARGDHEARSKNVKVSDLIQQKYCAGCPVAALCLVNSVSDKAKPPIGGLYQFGRSANAQMNGFVKGVGGREHIVNILRTRIDDPRREQLVKVAEIVLTAVFDTPSDPVAGVHEQLQELQAQFL